MCEALHAHSRQLCTRGCAGCCKDWLNRELMWHCAQAKGSNDGTCKIAFTTRPQTAQRQVVKTCPTR
eukprot:356557-Chlamydomonas_euryale.AAC.1